MAKRRSSRRPRLEGLEDRLVLSSGATRVVIADTIHPGSTVTLLTTPGGPGHAHFEVNKEPGESRGVERYDNPEAGVDFVLVTPSRNYLVKPER